MSAARAVAKPPHQSAVGRPSIGRAISTVTWPGDLSPAIKGRRSSASRSAARARAESGGGAADWGSAGMAKVSAMESILVTRGGCWRRGIALAVAHQAQIADHRLNVELGEHVVVARRGGELGHSALRIGEVAEDDGVGRARLLAGGLNVALLHASPQALGLG